MSMCHLALIDRKRMLREGCGRLGAKSGIGVYQRTQARDFYHIWHKELKRPAAIRVTITSIGNAPRNGGAMQTRYRLKAPIRAILDTPDGYVSVTIPAGAWLVRYSQPSEKSTTLFGMVGVYWEDRHYSVYPNNLLLKAEVVQSA